MDFVGWKIILQSTHELPNAFSALSYCRRQRTIELAMKKELSILGIETHDIGLQHINGEIRCELWNVLGIELLMTVPVIASHGFVRVRYHFGPPARPRWCFWIYRFLIRLATQRRARRDHQLHGLRVQITAGRSRPIGPNHAKLQKLTQSESAPS